MENATPSVEAKSRPTSRLMISPNEALGLVLDAAKQLPTEERPLLESTGLVLAESVTADRDQPPFDRAMMDGYAVPEGAAGQQLPIVGQIAAGQAADRHLVEGQCMEIMTGAPCPEGAAAVVPKEQIQLDGKLVSFPTQIEAGQHIAPRGSELQAGETVLQSRDQIDSLAVAALASFGKASVRVIRPPDMAIVTTGAELVPPCSTPGPSQIRDSNGPMLHTMAQGVGVERPVLEHAFDRMESIANILERLAGVDVLVLTGGVSAGGFDLVPDALEQQGADIVFHKVRQKPGKPLLFARRGDQLIFGLPGNPLASHFCFHRYVGAAIRKMQGREPIRPTISGRLVESVKPKGARAYFLLGVIDDSVDPDGLPRVRPVRTRSSADVFRMVAPNCYLEIPPGVDLILPGAQVSFTRIDGT